MSRFGFTSAVLIPGLAVASLLLSVSPAYAAYTQTHWRPEYQEHHALRAHRHVDRLTDRIQHARIRLARAEAHHRTRRAERIEGRLARLRAARRRVALRAGGQ
jgi:phosphoglucomutase